MLTHHVLIIVVVPTRTVVVVHIVKISGCPLSSEPLNEFFARCDFRSAFITFCAVP